MKNWLAKTIIFLFGMLSGWLIFESDLLNFYKGNLFWIGFITSLCLFLVILSISLNRLKNKSKQFQIASIFISVIFIGVLAVSYNIYLLNIQYEQQNNSINSATALQNRIGLSNLELNKIKNVALLINQLANELSNKEVRSLSDSSIKRIKSLSNSLTPFYYYNGDSLSSVKLSPGRGQLLLALSNLNIESRSFLRIIDETNFSYSLLENIDFSGLMLNNITLEGSHIQSCSFKGIILKKANLKSSTINDCDFTYSNIQDSDFSISQIKESDFSNSLLLEVDFNGIDGNYSVFHNSILRNSSFQWSNLIGSDFSKCDLDGADFWGSNLSRANLSNSNLNNSRLLESNLSQSNLINTKLNNVAVSRAWIERSNVSNAIGFKEIENDYSVERDSSDKYRIQKYFIKRKS